MATARCVTVKGKSVLKDALEIPLPKCSAQSAKEAALVRLVAVLAYLKPAVKASSSTNRSFAKTAWNYFRSFPVCALKFACHTSNASCSVAKVRLKVGSALETIRQRCDFSSERIVATSSPLRLRRIVFFIALERYDLTSCRNHLADVLH